MSHPFGRPHAPSRGLFLDELGVRHCRICGCSEFDACIGADGRPCHWVEPDLCSACVGLENWPRWETIISAVCLTALVVLLVGAALLGWLG